MMQQKIRWSLFPMACAGFWATAYADTTQSTSLALSASKATATLTLKHEGRGFGVVDIEGSGAARVGVKIALAGGQPFAEWTVKFGAAPSTRRRFYGLYGANADPKRDLTASVTLVEGAAFTGKLTVSHAQANPFEAERLSRLEKVEAAAAKAPSAVAKSAAPRATKVLPPVFAAPVAYRAAVAHTVQTTSPAPPAAACPKETIRRIVSQLAGSVRAEIELQSRWTKNGGPAPTVGRAGMDQYHGHNSARYGYLDVDDIRQPDPSQGSLIRLDKTISLFGIPVNLKANVMDALLTPCEDGKDIPECTRCPLNDEGKQDCSLFSSGWAYSKALDTVVSESPAIQGWLFGTACVEDRNKSVPTPLSQDRSIATFERAADAVVAEQSKIATLLDSPAPMDAEMRRNYDAVFQGGSINYAQCRALRNRMDDAFQDIFLADHSVFTGPAKLFARQAIECIDHTMIQLGSTGTVKPSNLSSTVRCIVGYMRNAFPNAARRHDRQYGATLPPPTGVTMPDDAWRKRFLLDLRTRLTPLQADGKPETMAHAVAKFRTYGGEVGVMARLFDAEEFLRTAPRINRLAYETIRNDMARLCGKCPPRNRVNLHISDSTKNGVPVTELRFFTGWNRIEVRREDITVAYLDLQAYFGFGDKVTLQITPEAVEGNFLPPRETPNDNSVYERSKDPAGNIDPFSQGGLLSLGPQCIPWAFKPRLDWLYTCNQRFVAACYPRDPDIPPVEESWKLADCCENDRSPRGKKCCDAQKNHRFCCSNTYTSARDRGCCKRMATSSVKREDLVTEELCRDQLRKLMILNHEAPFRVTDGAPHQADIMASCFVGTDPKNDKQRKRGSSDKEDDEEAALRIFGEIRGKTPEPGCRETHRAAVYRGDLARCYLQSGGCKGYTLPFGLDNKLTAAALDVVVRAETLKLLNGQFNQVPNPILRSMIAIENLRRAGTLKVIPAENTSQLMGKLNVETQRSNATLLYRINATTLDIGGRISDEEWNRTGIPFDIGLTIPILPYGYAGNAGAHPAVGAEIATVLSRPIKIDTGKIDAICQDESSSISWLVGCVKNIDDEIAPLIKRDVPRMVQWVMSGVLFGVNASNMPAMADKAIAGLASFVKGKVANSSLGSAGEPSRVQKCIEAFLRTTDPKELGANCLDPPKVNLLPESVNFGFREVGSPAVRRNILLTNDGQAVAVRGRPEKIGDASGAFTILGADGNPPSASAQIPSGGSETFSVHFECRQVGDQTASVVFKSDQGDRTFKLYGSCVAAPPPSKLVVAPKTTTFGIGVIGRAPIEKKVFVSVEGAAALTRQLIEVKGAAASQFAVAPGTPGTKLIRLGEREEIVVRLKCTEPGQKSAVLVASDSTRKAADVTTLTGHCVSP